MPAGPLTRPGGRSQPVSPGGGGLRRACAPPGFTLTEVLLVVCVSSLIAGVALPVALSGLEQVQAAAAARYVTGRLQDARMEAVKRGATVGIRFTRAAAGTLMAEFVDGNGDGVRSADIAGAIDYALRPATRLEDRLDGAWFGIVDGVRDPDTGAALSSDPIRLGASDILSFSPFGSASSGTLYVRGRGRQQYAVRVLGATGRVRVLRYDFTTSMWTEP